MISKQEVRFDSVDSIYSGKISLIKTLGYLAMAEIVGLLSLFFLKRGPLIKGSLSRSS